MYFKKNKPISQQFKVTRLDEVAHCSTDVLFQKLNTSVQGLSEVEVEACIEKYGENVTQQRSNDSTLKRLMGAFFDPFTIVLLMLATISFITDVVMAAPKDRDYSTSVIILTMVLLSGLFHFAQESRSNKAAEKLNALVKTTTCVIREGTQQEIPLKDVTIGDVVRLAAGDMIPADLRIIQAKDLFISQSSLTGESDPLEKIVDLESNKKYESYLEYPNLAFMGSDVISGSALGVVVAIGKATVFGQVAKTLTSKREATNFEKGVKSLSWLLIRFMLVMVPIVFMVNGITKHDWMEAFFFALSIAVGLTPEMLPMIVTTCLAKGAVGMAKKKTIVKNLHAIQNFGAMDILCTDKTGTLTKDKVELQYHLDIEGEEDARVLRYAYLNSYFQTGLKNLMDLAVIEKAKELSIDEAKYKYEKIDEIPFDFQRRRMSVVISDKNKQCQLITKGAVEEMLAISKFVDYQGQVKRLDEAMNKKILATVASLNDQGMRVIALARKIDPSAVDVLSIADESDMILMGYLAFLDPAKESCAQALQALKDHGVKVMVLTGDNDRVTYHVCKQVGLDVSQVVLGSSLDSMDVDELQKTIKETTVFAKLSPAQKATIVKLLRAQGHTVGYMGDGINDAAAMRASDVGISVDTAVDIAKESADIVLLEKDLMVLEEGIIEGRKTFANMMKYIKITASSNFGNIFSILLASAFLPFLPMLAIQLLVLNLIYDITCVAIPWDNVDSEYVKTPRSWSAKSIRNFMFYMGPISSIFDIITYLIMYFIICPMVLGGNYHAAGMNQALFATLFQTGWFVVSIWTQTLVVHFIRTEKRPFIQSRANSKVMIMSVFGIMVGTILPFTIIGQKLDLTALPVYFFLVLILIMTGYVIAVTLMKRYMLKKFNTFL